MRTILNRKAKLALLALLVAGLMLCGLTACDKGNTPADTTADTTASTEAPTDPVTETPTEEITTEEVTEAETELKGWEQDTGKFNDGIVIYEKKEDSQLVENYPAE